MRDAAVDTLGRIYDALTEVGATADCVRLQEDVAVALPASAPAHLRGTVLYDLACLYCRDGRADDARDTLADAVRLAPALAESAPADADLAPLFASRT
jgi:hypothetical protein